MSTSDIARGIWSDVYHEMLRVGQPEGAAMARADIVRIQYERRVAADGGRAALRELAESYESTPDGHDGMRLDTLRNAILAFIDR